MRQLQELETNFTEISFDSSFGSFLDRNQNLFSLKEGHYHNLSDTDSFSSILEKKKVLELEDDFIIDDSISIYSVCEEDSFENELDYLFILENDLANTINLEELSSEEISRIFYNLEKSIPSLLKCSKTNQFILKLFMFLDYENKLKFREIIKRNFDEICLTKDGTQSLEAFYKVKLDSFLLALMKNKLSLEKEACLYN